MSQMTFLDLPPETGTDLARKGAAKAVEHADRMKPGWSSRAFSLLVSYAQGVSTPFLSEDVRRYARSKGLSNPPDDRSWGAVMTRGRREGVIQFAGYQRVQNPQAHSRPATLWQAT